MSAPIVTVLITTYNYGKFIEQAIKSALAEDLGPEAVQVLVVDDGSTDDTAERVKKYGSRVEYFYQPNGGQAAALNAGIDRSRGEVIALLDADDFFLPGKLKRLAEVFQADATLGMVYHPLQEWYVESGERRDREFVAVSGDAQREPDKFLLYTAQPTSCIAFRRSILKRLLPIPESIRMLADCYLVSLIPFLAPIQALPEFLAVYRIHGKNCYTTGEQQLPLETRKKRVEMWRILIDAMRKWLAENGYTRKQVPVRSLLDRWSILLDREEFKVAKPGRVRFFRHILKSYRYELPSKSWRTALITHVDALGGLLVGQENFSGWHKRREDLTRWMGGLSSRNRMASAVPRDLK